MNILSVGNSFSQDAQRYVNRIAKADGFELKTYNLYIGGCSLATHFRNMLSGERAYSLEMNGESTGFYVSLKEALLNRAWDVVTLQQVSSAAPNYETYEPYLGKLADYVSLCVPTARVAIHQTWAYEQGSERLCDELGYKSPSDMFGDIEKSYKKAAEEIGADFVIPSGELFHKLCVSDMKVHRDTYHASLGVGRYALGLLWYAVLSGRDVSNCSCADFGLDEAISEEEAETIKRFVKELALKYV